MVALVREQCCRPSWSRLIGGRASASSGTDDYDYWTFLGVCGAVDLAGYLYGAGLFLTGRHANLSGVGSQSVGSRRLAS